MSNLGPRPAGRLLLLAALAGAAAVIGLWWRHLPHSFHSVIDTVAAVGQISGLLLAYVILLLVLIMARIPLLEDRVGADRLTRGHALAGRYAVALVFLHGLSIAWGYARAGRISIPAELGVLWREYPDVKWSLCAGVVLLGIGLSSIRYLRRRIGYQKWYDLHLLTYVALALAFAHQFAVGRDFVHDIRGRIVWSGLYASVFALVGYFRIVKPLLLNSRQRFHVARVVHEPSGCVSIYVAGLDVEALAAQAGQFFRLRFAARGLWRESHPFSLSALPTKTELRFTVMPVGNYTELVARIERGVRVIAQGPFGTLTPARRSHPKVVLIAGGIGITPLRAIFESVETKPGDLSLIYRARDSDQLTFKDELDELARKRGAVVHYLVGRTQELENPLEPEQLCRLLPDLLDADVFLCAPDQMMDEVTRSLLGLGVSSRHIHSEAFDLLTESTTGRWRLALGASIAAAVLVVFGLRSGLPNGGAGNVALVLAVASGSADPNLLPNGDRLIRGPVERTLFSSVQVGVVLRHGHVVDIVALMLPNHDAHSRQLSAMAAPILRREALASGTASINTVSGASYTSEAFAQSLQGALSQVPKA